VDFLRMSTQNGVSNYFKHSRDLGSGLYDAVRIRDCRKA